MPLSRRRRAAGRSAAGFSLVEVALSLGIIAVAFVPLLGMLPLGLDVSRKAIDTTISAQIAQQLRTEALQTDFSALAALADASHEAPSYFDAQGNKATDPALVVYQATWNVSTATRLSERVSTQKLATVTICILNRTGSRTSQEPDLMKNPDASKTTVLIADNGR